MFVRTKCEAFCFSTHVTVALFPEGTRRLSALASLFASPSHDGKELPSTLPLVKDHSQCSDFPLATMSPKGLWASNHSTSGRRYSTRQKSKSKRSSLRSRQRLCGREINFANAGHTSKLLLNLGGILTLVKHQFRKVDLREFADQFLILLGTNCLVGG